MDLLKVELNIKSLKEKNEDEIRNFGMIIEFTNYLYNYFKQTPTKKFLHIIIQLLSLITDKCLPMFYLSNKKLHFFLFTLIITLHLY
jgi:hypothetical protein